MALPYENATSGDKAFAEIQKILGRFGCDNRYVGVHASIGGQKLGAEITEFIAANGGSRNAKADS
jgi:hypothetical protein